MIERVTDHGRSIANKGWQDAHHGCVGRAKDHASVTAMELGEALLKRNVWGPSTADKPDGARARPQFVDSPIFGLDDLWMER